MNTVEQTKTWTKPEVVELGALANVAGGGSAMEGNSSSSAPGPS